MRRARSLTCQVFPQRPGPVYDGGCHGGSTPRARRTTLPRSPSDDMTTPRPDWWPVWRPKNRRGQRRRIYGDFSTPARAGHIFKHAIIPQQQFLQTAKDASDITLVIDADLLHSGRSTVFAGVVRQRLHASFPNPRRASTSSGSASRRRREPGRPAAVFLHGNLLPTARECADASEAKPLQPLGERATHQKVIATKSEAVPLGASAISWQLIHFDRAASASPTERSCPQDNAFEIEHRREGRCASHQANPSGRRSSRRSS